MGVKANARIVSTVFMAGAGLGLYGKVTRSEAEGIIGNFTGNVLSKHDMEAAEKDIDDLGETFDGVEPAQMYKAGAFILREAVERAYKEMQVANEKEILDYVGQYGTYAGRAADAETDVFLPVKSRENFINNANAPTLDISNTLATYNASLCNIPPSNMGYLADLKTKVFNTELYKDMYTYRSVLKEKEITKRVPNGRDEKGRIKYKTIKYKELWTESELDPFDDSVLLASFFEKSPYYQLEKEVWQNRDEKHPRSQKRFEKEWETKKKGFMAEIKASLFPDEIDLSEKGYDQKVKNEKDTNATIGKKTHHDDKELEQQLDESLKKKYLARNFLDFIHGQPYYGSHLEYVYSDNTTGMHEDTSLFGAKIKKFFYDDSPMQKYVRNNYYETITVTDEDVEEAQSFVNKLKTRVKGYMTERNRVYGKVKMKRRKLGKEAKEMDISDETGEVISKVRKKSLDKKYRYSDFDILKRTDLNRFQEWRDGDQTKEFNGLDSLDKSKLGDIYKAGSYGDNNPGKMGGTKASYSDMKSKYPDAIEIHENLVKLAKEKNKKVKSSKGKPINPDERHDLFFGVGKGLNLLNKKIDKESLTEWIRHRNYETTYDVSVGKNAKNEKAKSNNGQSSQPGKTTFQYLRGDNLKKVTEKNRKDYQKYKEAEEKKKESSGESKDKKKTQKAGSTLSAYKLPGDPSESSSYDPDSDGRGITLDINFPVDQKIDQDGTLSQNYYVPLTVEQQIALTQTYMYNSIEPASRVTPAKESTLDDGEYDFSKIDRKKYHYAKELEDLIWGSYRREKAFFIFHRNVKKDGEGLDLDIEHKIATGGELRATGFDGGGSGNGKIVSIAEKLLGEGPQKFWNYLGMSGQHWCAMFVSFVMNEAGFKKDDWVKTAATTEALAFAKKKGKFKKPGGKPNPGDVIWFKFNSGVNEQNETNHIGIVKEVKGNKIKTIEGNSGPGAAPYGTHVTESEYSISDKRIVGYMSTGSGGGGSSGGPQDSSGSSEASEIEGMEAGDSMSSGSDDSSKEEEEQKDRPTQAGGLKSESVSTAFTLEDLLDNSGSSKHSLSGYLDGSDGDMMYKFLRSRGYSKYATAAIMGSFVATGKAKWDGKDIKFEADKGKSDKVEEQITKIDEEITKIGKEKYKKSKTKIDLATQAELEKLEKKKYDLVEKAYKGKSLGFGKWKGNRFLSKSHGLYHFAKRYGRNWDSLDAQIGFMDWELNHWAQQNFVDCPRVNYDENLVMGFVEEDPTKAKKTNSKGKNKKSKKNIQANYTLEDRLTSSKKGRKAKMVKKEDLSNKMNWDGSLYEFKNFDKQYLNDACSVFINCYIDPTGGSDNLVSKSISEANKVVSEYVVNREENKDKEHEDYIAFRGQDHDIAKESYLLLPNDAGGDSDEGGEVMFFKDAVCSRYGSETDKTFAYGPVQGQYNVVAAHNMPYGTIVYIKALDGKYGGGTFKASNGKTYDLGPKNNGKFIVADTGGPFFDFDIFLPMNAPVSKQKLDVKVIKWGDGKVAWSITEAIEDAKRRDTWDKYQNAFNMTRKMGFKTKDLTKFKDHDKNNPLLNP